MNVGGALPCAYRYNGVIDNTIIPTNVDRAHEAGFTGKGVKVGVLDDPLIQGYDGLEGRIASSSDYRPDRTNPTTHPGHGSAVTYVLGGRQVGEHRGGVAPDAVIYHAAVCDSAGCHPDAAGAAISDMAAQGVRIFNASFGGSYGAGLDDADARATAYWYRPLAQADALLVSSGGNSGGEQPGGLGAMPTVDERFVGRTIIGVAGVVDDKGNVSELSDYSNVCGYTATWCLTAAGLNVFPAVPGTEYSYGGDGTSMVAPQISGVAALVQQAFPWMTSRNLQQTVLTTATDIGAPGVDDVFGWGLLNAHKAIHGPAQFQAFDFLANVDSGRYTFANDISGDRGIVKDGAGALVLAGSNTYTGATVINGGELVAMTGVGGSVSVHDGGTFTAGGTIGGDFSATEGATTGIALGNALNVAGTATLAGDVRLLAPAEGYTVGTTETLLRAGELAGTFDGIQYGSGFFYSATLSYTDSEVTAALTRASASAMALQSSSVQRVIEGARQADALFGFIDALPAGDRAALVSAAGRLTGAQTAAEAELALASLTGEVHGTARAAAISMAAADAALFGDRVATLDPADAGAWVQATNMDAEFDRDGFASADVRQSGLAVGVDRQVGNAIVGAALSNGRGWGSLDALGGRYDSDQVGLSVYGRTALPMGYLAASLGFTRHDVDAHRGVLLGGAVSAIDGEREDDVWALRIEAGTAYGAFTPFLAGGYVRHEQGAMVERGADGLGLVSGSNTASIHFGEIGVRFAHAVDRLTFTGTLAGRWTGGDTRPSYYASFAGAPEVGVEIHGQRMPARGLRGVLGLEYRTGQNMTWNLGVGGESGSGDATNLTATGGLRISF
ncbi:S8 family serine peptidase [Luteimonas sp. MHLX1A]|uniref:S8 family serine peptidase n=1 Tax=Alterluteimonas muca TaxID=2878684 RepID=UPI001E5FA12A|nr:S8 family serine peptidase [Luteimonas sp. MHLX1A]MCD9046763.1 S8 family serine peptidase [Luteimonas sp. MHLX1A]